MSSPDNRYIPVKGMILFTDVIGELSLQITFHFPEI